MQKKQKTSLVWFRNDLRVNDQASLYQAAKESEQVIALYCFDPRHFAETQFGLKNGKIQSPIFNWNGSWIASKFRTTSHRFIGLSWKTGNGDSETD